MQVDTPYALYHKPNNKFVGSFIGSPSMNIIKTNLLAEDSNIMIKLGEYSLILEEHMAKKVKKHVGKNVWFGIRPESINVLKDKSKPAKNSVKAKVVAVEQMGNEEIVYFEIEGKQFIAVQDSDRNYFTKAGDDEVFVFNMNEIHIFDYESEENISI